ncbi:MAG: 5-methyltetrahydropteroyltriglutamate--homocysteine S-methyltransferase [Acidobacteriia bacterium]|nr:5-methyltetrahydropteroyltriglutamate--homocysteine S-methyltransferase [Terriglobia bacterium]
MAFPYRADHVGSLLRPQEILEARVNPAVTKDQLRAIEDRQIRRILERQRDAGFRIFTDGELRRRGFMSDFYESVTGIDNADAVNRQWNGGAVPAGLRGHPGVVTGKIQQKKRMAKHELDFLKQHSPGAIKVTIPTPNQFPAIAYKKGISEKAYPTRSEFLWDLVPLFKAEMQALVQDGVKYLQVDAPRYSYYIDPKWRAYIQNEMGMDPNQALEEAIRVDNACIEGVNTKGVTVAMHLCRGNNQSHWYAEGGYDPIAEKLFGQLNVDAFLLEYESERAGTFEPLRFVPPGKVVVLGLVSSKVPELEKPDQLARRIEEASRYVPLENLSLSPQCGFASAMEGNLLTEEQQWRKLQLVVDTARLVWKDA